MKKSHLLHRVHPFFQGKVFKIIFDISLFKKQKQNIPKLEKHVQIELKGYGRISAPLPMEKLVIFSF